MDQRAFKSRFEVAYQAKYDGQEPKNFTSLDFVGALGSMSSALLYSKLFCPDFVEVEGMIFLKDLLEDAGGSERVHQLLIEQGNDLNLVEKIINCFHVNLSFPNRVPGDVCGDDRLLAQELAGTWRIVLQNRYPSRQFSVQMLEEDGEASVCFHQIY